MRVVILNLAYLTTVGAIAMYVWTGMQEADLSSFGSMLGWAGTVLPGAILTWAGLVFRNQLDVGGTPGLSATEFSALRRRVQLTQWFLAVVAIVSVFAIVFVGIASNWDSENRTWERRVNCAAYTLFVVALAFVPHLIALTKSTYNFRNSLRRRAEIRERSAAYAKQMREEGKQGFGRDSKLERYNEVAQQG